MSETDLVHGLDNPLLSRFLKKHFEDARPAEVVSYGVKLAVPKGENYTSLVYRVKIDCLLTTGKKKSFSLIVKTELQSEIAKDALSTFPVFRTEIKMYTTILTLMEALQEEFEDKREPLWANLYGYEPYKMVAFEDLTEKGYAGVNRRDSLDLNHALLALRNLARFHAMGKVLLSRGLISDVEDKGKFSLAATDEPLLKWWDALITVLTSAMVEVWGSEWKDLADRLEKQKDHVAEKIADLDAKSDKKFYVLNHGDPWMCNMMFKYMEYEPIPISHRFLDFQVCHVSSFIFDVEYFIYTSVHHTVHREHKAKLLTAYHESLEKNLQSFRYSGYIPTLDDVMSESTRVDYFQMGVVLTSCMMTADTTNAFDMEKLTTGPAIEVFDPCVFGSEKAQLAISEEIKRFAATGII